jgi:carboxyl-terminal processing protease
MVGELNDSHTRFHTPRERRERKEQQAISIGVTLFEVEGRSVVVSIEPNTEASRVGIEAGMIVRTIDGVPIETKLAESKAYIEGSSSERAVRLRLYRRILDGEPGSTVKLGLVRGDGSSFEVVLTRRTVSELPAVNWRRLPSGYGFIKLNMWRSPVHREFRRALEHLEDSAGLIIDLRGNPGGVVDEVLEVASCFFSRRVPFGRFISRSGKSAPLYTDPDDDHFYGGPVTILVNESSGSGSELFAGVMQEAGRAMVLGRQSCGCLLGITRFREFDGGGELAVSELAFVSPKGRRFEGTGVVPDEAVALTISDLRARLDLTVERAERLLNKLPKASVNVW